MRISTHPRPGRVAILLATTVALAAGGGRLRAQTPIPLDTLLSAPFPSAMTAAPASGRVAWVVNDRGARNIWVASPPDYRARKLTAYTEDDGQEIGDLAWSPDGRTIVYVRGGSANRQGEIPNPTSDPAGQEQAVWRISVDGGEPAKIGAGTNPVISPRGDIVAFTVRGQIWSAPLDGGEASQLMHARGGAGSLAWAPDGSKLAFESGRGDHSFVGVYDFATKSIRWLDPGLDSDGNPVWSPDGTRIAFLRFPASTSLDLFTPVREAQPWSIRVADVATGATREVWRAAPGRGSAFRGVVASSQLFWGAGNQLVFPWERDGWTHLYSFPLAGGEPVLLTPGDFEVEYVTITPDRATIVYNSNQGDIDRRDLWRLPVAGGAPVQLTRGEMIEWDPAVTSDGGTIAFLRSGPKRPAEAMLLRGAGEPETLPGAPVAADFPVDRLVTPQPVVFTAADGMRIHGQLFVPPGSRPGEKHPALLFMHGGSRRQMVLGWHYSSYYNNAYAMNQHMASKGYVVLSVNYRSGIGYGMEFREAENYGAEGGAEFNDIRGAGLYLQTRPDVDADRIGLWGGSYGGYLTAMGLSRASDLFKAGADFHGVHDWNVGIRTFVPSYNKLERPEAARTAFEASPMSSLDGWRSPVLLIHGDDDRNVSFSESVALAEALRARGVHVETLVFPDEVHSFLRHESWLRAYRAAADFFDRMLKERP